MYSNACLIRNINESNLIKFLKDRQCVRVSGEEGKNITWNTRFNEVGVQNYHVKEAGGKTSLKKYIDKIINENADIRVACDKDYDEVLNILNKNKKIIYTYGYSIENTMHCSRNINELIQNYTRQTSNYKDEVNIWYSALESSCKELVIYDLANVMFAKGIKVMGDNSAAFMDNNSKDIKLSEKKLIIRLILLQGSFTDVEINKCKSYYKEYTCDKRYLIRGHFLENLVINLIKRYTVDVRGKKITLSPDNIFSNLVNNCLSCTKSCPDKLYLKQQICSAIDLGKEAAFTLKN